MRWREEGCILKQRKGVCCLFRIISFANATVGIVRLVFNAIQNSKLYLVIFVSCSRTLCVQRDCDFLVLAINFFFAIDWKSMNKKYDSKYGFG